MSFQLREDQASFIFAAKDAQGESTKGAKSTNSGTSRGKSLKWYRLLNSMFVPLLISAASLFGLARPAAAEVVDSVGAHLGFLSEKPKSLPLDLPVLLTGRVNGTTSYTVSAPYSATGVTLVLYYQSRSKVKVKRRKTSDGKKLEHNAWSGMKAFKAVHQVHHPVVRWTWTGRKTRFSLRWSRDGGKRRLP